MGKIRWKKEARETGLRAVMAGPRGSKLWDGECVYATVSPKGSGFRRGEGGWYWVAGWDSNVPSKNTCDAPVDTEKKAKAQAREYVMSYVKTSDGPA